MKHLVLMDDQALSTSSICVLSKDPYMVGVASRQDIAHFSSVEEMTLPGIYVLLGDGKRYVGQASCSILDRILRHHDTKEWWSSVVFFGREDGRMNKAQMDYLEKRLIHEVDDLFLDLDNIQQGNDSFIDKMDRLRADDLYRNCIDALAYLPGADVFGVAESTGVVSPDIPDGHYVVFSSDGHLFSNDNIQELWYSIIRHYLVFDPVAYTRLLNFALVDAPVSVINFIGDTHAYKNNKKLSSDVVGVDDFVVYTAMTVYEVRDQLLVLGEIIDVTFTLNDQFSN